MEAVITRIIEIEKESALDIERAEEACRKNIEARRLTLEEEQKKANFQIISIENSRLNETIQALNRQTEEASRTSGRNYETRFHDPALISAIQKRIIAILLK
jgi:hypothetical protein